MRKPLPRAFNNRSVAYDYGIVKFRHRHEAYTAEHQVADFQVVCVGTLDAQVRVHFFLQGLDRKSGLQETVDVDIYLPISGFRRVSGLLRGMRFRKDKSGRLVPDKAK